MKTLTKIQIGITVFSFVCLVVGFKAASWLHSTAYNDPVREQWRPWLGFLWFITTVPWLLFTGVHIIIVIGRKFMPKDNA